jgi:ferritin-like metal-binding protein YciE
MAKLKSLEDFFITELKDLNSAESQIVKALPKLIKAVNSRELKDALQNHLKETENQVTRLKKISDILGKPLTGKKCTGMEAIIEEGNEIMESDSQPEVLDVGIIAAAQKVEHYEMAGYGCAKTYARLLGYDEVEDLLQESLDEEGNADKTLTEIADELNPQALQPAESEK